MLAASFAATTTVPTPVMVSVLPLSVPGPEITLYVTALPEAPAVAVSVIGAIPYVTGDAAVKLMVCEAGLTTSVCVT